MAIGRFGVEARELTEAQQNALWVVADSVYSTFSVGSILEAVEAEVGWLEAACDEAEYRIERASVNRLEQECKKVGLVMSGHISAIKLEGARASLAKHLEELSHLSQQKSDLQSQLARLEVEISEKQAKIDTLNGVAQTQEGNIADLELRLVGLSGIIATLEQQIAASEATVQALVVEEQRDRQVLEGMQEESAALTQSLGVQIEELNEIDEVRLGHEIWRAVGGLAVAIGAGAVGGNPAPIVQGLFEALAATPDGGNENPRNHNLPEHPFRMGANGRRRW